MPKNPLQGWTHKKGGPQMHPGQLPDGSSQDFYFPEDHFLMPGWFKGMEQIIRERDLWPESGLKAQYEGFNIGEQQLHYRASPQTKNMEEMQANVIAALDNVPLTQIRRYANRSAKFMDAYVKGLNGAQAAWAARKYHGHRVLPEDILTELEDIQTKTS
ncbi:hypothetical protein M422DRAFT_256017 [Sphaerobolus stellatus SS14]|uniref:Uncharacterized protein n=1 Tax=Sphaerobolus stellatus (strain SS14) TaxID=990650 RepID=A0A0C9VS64_SPHS4|nr:hypothetical protein M422DRAFT_256017 [Sphaerobolus stellatus SS14]